MLTWARALFAREYWERWCYAVYMSFPDPVCYISVIREYLCTHFVACIEKIERTPVGLRPNCAMIQAQRRWIHVQRRWIHAQVGWIHTQRGWIHAQRGWIHAQRGRVETRDRGRNQRRRYRPLTFALRVSFLSNLIVCYTRKQRQHVRFLHHRRAESETINE